MSHRHEPSGKSTEGGWDDLSFFDPNRTNVTSDTSGAIPPVKSKIQEFQTSLKLLVEEGQRLSNELSGAPEASAVVYLLNNLTQLLASLSSYTERRGVSNTTHAIGTTSLPGTEPSVMRVENSITSRTTSEEPAFSSCAQGSNTPLLYPSNFEHQFQQPLKTDLEKMKNQDSVERFNKTKEFKIEQIERAVVELSKRVGVQISEDVIKMMLQFIREVLSLVNQGRQELAVPEHVVAPVNPNYVPDAVAELKAELQREEELRRKQEEEEDKRMEEEMKARSLKRREEMSAFMNSLVDDGDRRREIDKNEQEKERERAEMKQRLENMSRKREAELVKESKDEQRKLDEKFQREEAERRKILSDIEAKIVEENKKAYAKSIQHDEEMREKERRLLFEKSQHEENMRRIHQEYEEQREKTERMWEETYRKMQEVYERLEQLQKFQVWNEIIENNWTSKLNILRDSNREVVQCFNQLDATVHSMNTVDRGAYNNSNRKPILLSRTQSTLDAVQHQKQLMKKEIEALNLMYDNTGKTFLCHIRESVVRVIAACDHLEQNLRMYLEQLNNDSEPSNLRHLWAEVAERSRALSLCSTAIPTLAELKLRFREEMNNRQESEEINTDGADFETVRIEEME